MLGLSLRPVLYLSARPGCNVRKSFDRRMTSARSLGFHIRTWAAQIYFRQVSF